MIEYTLITLSLLQICLFVSVYLFICPFCLLVFNAGAMSHQHFEPKWRGQPWQPAARDTNMFAFVGPTVEERQYVVIYVFVLINFTDITNQH